ncbi:hypothetical protein [Actinobaculum massiliense]|uniref:hypothetical protein n=1 Tax=Actinobaculum massiliense TaxID=202789 RepID=UPI00071AFA96|nr:hypothetical protein [Actinobaculum massiliense]
MTPNPHPTQNPTRKGPALAAAADQLADLAVWRAELGARVEGLLGLSGGTLELAPVSHPGASPVEDALIRVEGEREVLARLEELASEWAWRGEDLDGCPCRFMAARLAWAARHFPLERPLQTIETAWNTVARPPAQKVNRVCPAHPQTMTLLHAAPGGYYCPECDLVRSEEETRGLAYLRILSANPALPVALAAELTGTPAATIRKWISRGHVTCTDGRVCLKDIDTARHRARPGLHRTEASG